jgi:hypothetical protein
MKFLVKTTLKILFSVILLIIPVTLIITFFALGKANIPLRNIGIRNVIQFSRNYFLPSLFLSYLIATLLVISLIDKMKVKSLILLHIPAIIVGCIFAAGIYYIRLMTVSSPQIKGELRLGYRTFFKEGVFIETKGRKLYIENGENDRRNLYLYDEKNNALSVVRNITTRRDGKNQLIIDSQNRNVSIVSKTDLPGGQVRISFGDFQRGKNINDSRLLTLYGRQIGSIQRIILNRLKPLGLMDRYLLLGSLFLSVLMISIPLVYGLNDRGWGFSGLIGVFFILAILPFWYGFVFRLIVRFRPRLLVLGKYEYAFPSLVFVLCGILIDIIVKKREKRRG